MKSFLFWILLFALLHGNPAEAASVPFNRNSTPLLSESTLRIVPSASTQKWKNRGKKNIIERLQYRIVERKLKRHLKSSDAKAAKGHWLSTVSLVLGIIGAIFLLIQGTLGIGILLGLAALIMGIVYLSKDEKTQGGKTKATIGLILGAIGAVLGLVGLVLIAMFSGFTGA